MQNLGKVELFGAEVSAVVTFQQDTPLFVPSSDCCVAWIDLVVPNQWVLSKCIVQDWWKLLGGQSLNVVDRTSCWIALWEMWSSFTI